MPLAIKSVASSAGFLQECKVELVPGLNCVIGARGTCKSTLIESIRFAFDSDEERVQELVKQGGETPNSSTGLIHATLGSGSIKCELEFDGNAYTVEREIGGAPRLLQNGVREYSEFSALERIEIVSQGDLQRIADEKNTRMRIGLIDRPNAATIDRLKSQRRDACVNLETVGNKLRSLRAQAQQLDQELQAESLLREQLNDVKAKCPTLPPALEQQRYLFEARSRALSALNSTDAQRTEAINALKALNPLAERLEASIQTASSQKLEESNLALQIAEEVRNILVQIVRLSGRLSSLPLREKVDDLARDFEKSNESYYQLRQDQQAINESLKQQQVITRQIEHLEKLRGERDAVSITYNDFLEARTKLRAEIANIDNQVYELRIAQVDSINAQHGDRVYLTLDAGSDRKQYVTLLNNLLSGSRIRGQDEVASAIGNTFSSTSLVDIVECGNGQPLSDVLGRDIGQMNRVVAHLIDHPQLYSLEALDQEAHLDISLFDKGVSKPVETLSKGQKATALLPLILRDADYPLLIDQPEDDLDNSFVFENLVRTLRELKLKRQLILVTHNANIPVLGEAERVIVMSMNGPKTAKNPLCGAVDERKEEILNLLEGGAEAFARRERSYNSLLKDFK